LTSPSNWRTRPPRRSRGQRADYDNLQLWSCNTASPYNDVWIFTAGPNQECDSLAGCLAVADDYFTTGPWIATVELPFTGNGAVVQMWNAASETTDSGVVWIAGVYPA
jgi:hypothetical protein